MKRVVWGLILLGSIGGLIVLGGDGPTARGSQNSSNAQVDTSESTPARYLHNQYVLRTSSNNSDVSPQTGKQNTNIRPFSRTDTNHRDPSISAESALVMDFDSRQMLYQKSPYEKRNIASITKLMTAMVVLDQYSYGDTQNVTMSRSAFQAYGGGYIRPNDVLTVEELLHALLLASSNDSAAALAEYFGGEKRFVDQMNQKADTLELHKTEFANPHGLDAPNKPQYSTAYDVMKMGEYVYEHYPTITKLLQVEEKTLTTNDGREIQISNINKLVDTLKTRGGKTGYTEDAGETFFTVTSIDGRDVGVVVLGSDIGKRFQDTRALIEWTRKAYNAQ